MPFARIKEDFFYIIALVGCNVIVMHMTQYITSTGGNKQASSYGRTA
jgi:hypothetical protein